LLHIFFLIPLLSCIQACHRLPPFRALTKYHSPCQIRPTSLKLWTVLMPQQQSISRIGKSGSSGWSLVTTLGTSSAAFFHMPLLRTAFSTMQFPTTGVRREISAKLDSTKSRGLLVAIYRHFHNAQNAKNDAQTGRYRWMRFCINQKNTKECNHRVQLM
jgi:hypothetical protein